MLCICTFKLVDISVFRSFTTAIIIPVYSSVGTGAYNRSSALQKYCNYAWLQSNLEFNRWKVMWLAMRTVTPQVVPGPSTANCVAVDDPPGPTMAAMDGLLCCSGPPTANQFMMEINRGWQHHWITTPCMGICYNSGSRMSDLGSGSMCRLVKLNKILMLIFWVYTTQAVHTSVHGFSNLLL